MTLSIACQKIVRAELWRRSPERGMTKRAAANLRVSQTSYSHYLSGHNSIPEHIAWRILEQARHEDLILADKIEAELLRPSLLKEGG